MSQKHGKWSGGFRPPAPPAVDQKLRITLWSIGIYLGAECKGGAMQNGTCKAYFNFSLAAFDTTTTTTTTTTSKTWPLHLKRWSS